VKKKFENHKCYQSVAPAEPSGNKQRRAIKFGLSDIENFIII